MVIIENLSDSVLVIDKIVLSAHRRVFFKSISDQSYVNKLINQHKISVKNIDIDISKVLPPSTETQTKEVSTENEKTNTKKQINKNVPVEGHVLDILENTEREYKTVTSGRRKRSKNNTEVIETEKSKEEKGDITNATD